MSIDQEKKEHYNSFKVVWWRKTFGVFVLIHLQLIFILFIFSIHLGRVVGLWGLSVLLEQKSGVVVKDELKVVNEL